MITILDGPLGTEIAARGVPTPPPLWSALALVLAPEVVRAVHRAYAEAGATVHTANTFRTKRRQVLAYTADARRGLPSPVPPASLQWEELSRLALSLARSAVPAGHLVAGSISPLEDCYRPDLSPPDAQARSEHRELARMLADGGADLLLCETFPHLGEALIAVEEAAATGLPVWVAFTAGPNADLLTPEAIESGAREAVQRGASAVLVNCIPAARTLRFVERLAGLGVPFGAYANAGSIDEGMGWKADDAPGITRSAAAEAYASFARMWADAGASILGSCCGTGPEHIEALANQFGEPSRLEAIRRS